MQKAELNVKHITANTTKTVNVMLPILELRAVMPVIAGKQSVEPSPAPVRAKK